MFYPNLARRVDYSRKPNNEYYSDYKRYREEITEDGQTRCGYCDIKLNELGGEGLQLDHFRPQNLFPELSADPTNLVLACAGCNRLKSNFWPENYPVTRFIDPFEQSRADMITVQKSGMLSSASERTFEYQLQLLDLNRPARTLVRQRRIMIKIADHFIDQAIALIDGISNELAEKSLSDADKFDLQERCSLLRELLVDLKTINGWI